jgi:hypothetical protein
MNKRIAKKKLEQFYNEREELLGLLRDFNISVYGEYPIIDVDEREKERNGNSEGWGRVLGKRVNQSFRLERARLMNAIR